MKKKVLGYIFGISLLALFITAVSEPKITGMTINIVKNFPLELYTLLAFIFAASIVISGIAYHRAIDIVQPKRNKSLKKLDEYIIHCLHNNRNRNEYSIKQELLAYGWHEDYIEDSFNFIKNDKNIIDFHNYSKYITKR